MGIFCCFQSEDRGGDGDGDGDGAPPSTSSSGCSNSSSSSKKKNLASERSLGGSSRDNNSNLVNLVNEIVAESGIVCTPS
jgi:hypothetical protein